MVDDFEAAEQFSKIRALAAPFIGAFILGFNRVWCSCGTGARRRRGRCFKSPRGCSSLS